jgi:hypothetical protein
MRKIRVSGNGDRYGPISENSACIRETGDHLFRNSAVILNSFIKRGDGSFNNNSQELLSTTPENAWRNGAKTPRVLHIDARHNFTNQRHFLCGEDLPLIFDTRNRYVRNEEERILYPYRESIFSYRDCSRLLDCAD